MDTEKKFRRIALISLPLSFVAAFISGNVFNNCLQYQDTDMHWKFVCSLIGFSIFTVFFLVVLIAAAVHFFRVRNISKSSHETNP